MLAAAMFVREWGELKCEEQLDLLSLIALYVVLSVEIGLRECK